MSDDDPRLSVELVRAAPALARLAAGTSWRVTRWGISASVRTSARVARAATDPVLVAHGVVDLGHELRHYARDLLGVSELEDRVALLVPAGDNLGESVNGSPEGAVPEAVRLRVRGAHLLEAAAQIEPEHAPAHPAYARILTELAPDEGRILRLLALKGAQPLVDVRASNLFGVGSEMIDAGLSMIGADAGCQYRDRIPAYLNNLQRLGLVWLRHEPLGDASAYQVLEAQPEVLAALKRASRAKTIQRSISLTPFGEDFCAVCLPLGRAEVERLAGGEPS